MAPQNFLYTFYGAKTCTDELWAAATVLPMKKWFVHTCHTKGFLVATTRLRWTEHELYNNHLGMSRKSLVRSYLWCLQLNTEIEAIAHNCQQRCAVNLNPPSHPWLVPHKPWYRSCPVEEVVTISGSGCFLQVAQGVCGQFYFSFTDHWQAKNCVCHTQSTSQPCTSLYQIMGPLFSSTDLEL